MLLSKQDIRKVSFWWKKTSERDGKLFDTVIISYKDDLTFAYLTYEKVRIFYYYDSLKDYVMQYAPSYEFIELKQQLSKYFNKVHLNTPVTVMDVYEN